MISVKKLITLYALSAHTCTEICIVDFSSWEDPLEKGMATHSGILTWRIPWTEEPNGLQSMGSQKVGHN